MTSLPGFETGMEAFHQRCIVIEYLKPRKYTHEEVLAVIELIQQTVPDTWSAFLDVELGRSKVTQEQYRELIHPMWLLLRDHHLVENVAQQCGLFMNIRTEVRK